jgi:hypothetical protein
LYDPQHLDQLALQESHPARQPRPVALQLLDAHERRLHQRHEVDPKEPGLRAPQRNAFVELLQILRRAVERQQIRVARVV